MIGRDLISIRDLSDAGIEGLFELAAEFSTSLRGRLDLAKDAVMAALFYEPSTRTRMSFEAAMLRLGGQVISMTDPAASSAAKGETLADTVRIVESYTDLIVLRHPREGAAQVAADFAGTPVINAGDGSREHPTQTLLDLYTIFQEKGRLAGITVALCGDLKYGRTVHSLAQALARFGAHMICVAPPGLELPPRIRQQITAQFGTEIAHYPSLAEAPLEECDVLYVTRLQRERFTDASEFERVRSTYTVSRQTLTRARADAIVLHPLPRVNELDFALDGDPRAAYFRQAAYGVPVRMALIAALLGLRTINGLYNASSSPAQPAHLLWRPLPAGEVFACANARCITTAEPGIPAWAQARDDGARRCAYCEAILGSTCPVS
ncbi:MAG TPA: aspartate carbamoyltransferase [Armatimonadota bacterium]|jgi:aspartate carbamoyltransferase catalytic subunit